MFRKVLIAALSAATCGLMAAPSFAADSSNEPMAMFYWQQTFGSSARSEKGVPSYGFAVSRQDVKGENAYSVGNPLSFLQGGRPAYMDARFNDYGLQKLYVNGLNALEKKMVYNAAEGATGTTTQIHWGWFATGLALGAVILNDMANDGECVATQVTFALNISVDSCGNPVTR